MKPTIVVLTNKDEDGDMLVAANPEAVKVGNICGIYMYPDWGWNLLFNTDKATWGKGLSQLVEQGWRFDYLTDTCTWGEGIRQLMKHGGHFEETPWFEFNNAEELLAHVAESKNKSKPIIALLTKTDHASKICLILVNKDARFLSSEFLGLPLGPSWGWDVADNTDRKIWGNSLDNLFEHDWRARYINQDDLPKLKIPKEAHFVIYNKATGLENYLNTLALMENV